ncbi:manganese efflux pump MntP [Virgibacillus sp. W0430]|uniref:manganese efflux pump MntP n=1 Tax=Virgibacillus sp. W0430 TaxID=3391580 RepID=UPI003F463EF8
MAFVQLGEFTTLVFMAVALGLDAFSVSLGLGMKRPRLKRIALIGLLIGSFHILFPLIGILAGKVIAEKIGQYTVLGGGLLLVGIGAHMIFSAFNQEPKRSINSSGIHLLLLACSVSIDSFSVGLSLGMSNAKTIMAIILFGSISTILTWAGMLLGRKVRGYLGAYSEILGGSILCAFGMYILFS